MSPRGFYQRESIHPHFTTEEYLNSDQHKAEIDHYITIEKRLRSWFGYPRKLARKVWYAILVWAGYLRDLTK